jgi:hypothetical protein
MVVDDGGHQPEQQTVSLNELLPHLRPGGVYFCEDIHGSPDNPFASYVYNLAHGLNDCRETMRNLDDDDRRIVTQTTQFTRKLIRFTSIHSSP